jgi:tetratricopeptide (TPR) repeat protein
MVMEALEQLLLATQADPWAATARANLALVARDPGMLSALIVDRTRGSTGETEGEESYRLGRVLLAAGRLEPARELLSRRIETGKADSVALLEMGSLELQAGNPEAALRPLTRALPDRPSDVPLHLRIAGILADVGRPLQALAAARAACRIAPDRPEPCEMLARLLATSAPDEAEAMGEYAETLRLGRGDETLGMALLDGDIAAADPATSSGRVNGTRAFRLGHYHQAIALRQQGAFADALAELWRATGPQCPCFSVRLVQTAFASSVPFDSVIASTRVPPSSWHATQRWSSPQRSAGVRLFSVMQTTGKLQSRAPSRGSSATTSVGEKYTY